jgi:hypothetical protein
MEALLCATATQVRKVMQLAMLVLGVAGKPAAALREGSFFNDLTDRYKIFLLLKEKKNALLPLPVPPASDFGYC